jgi:hypothetical protein
VRLRFNGQYGFDDLGYVTVWIVYYDRPQGWALYYAHNGQRMPGGPWATRDEAEAAAQVALADVPPGPARRPEL